MAFHPEEPDLVRRLLLWLLKRAASNQSKRPRDVATAEAVTKTRFTPFKQPRELRVLLDAHTVQFESLDHDRYLWLEPIKIGRPALPVMAVGYDFSGSFPSLSFRVALFVLDDTSFGEELWCIGYRFETPSGDGGVHHYYHVQHIVHMLKNVEQLVLPTPSWMPVVQPAVPLDADGPVSLFVSTIVALYGRQAVKNLRGDEPGLWEKVRPHIPVLSSRFEKYEPRYFKVVEVSGAVVYYKTWYAESRFVAIAWEAHPGCEISVCSQHAWSVATGESRRVV